MSYDFVYAASRGAREVNQDSYYACSAWTCFGEAVCAAVCDGVGGLSSGEYASSEMVRELDRWFRLQFPGILEAGAKFRELEPELTGLVRRVSTGLRSGSRDGRSPGTTAVIFLAVKHRYVILNVGDSRAYRLGGIACRQLTCDQTEAMLEVKRGRMSLEAAERSPMGGVLQQCIGYGRDPVPDFSTGIILPGERYLLCSDGFRHKNTMRDMNRALRGRIDGNTAEKSLEKLIDTAILKGERDNITALVIWRK